jgi:hypothetical protein
LSLFLEWNNLLLSEFFSPSSAEEDVWLQTSRHELDSFGLHLGGAAGLIDAVKAGPEWVEPDITHHFATAASRLMFQRRSTIRPSKYVDPAEFNEVYKDYNAPTYLPYLALWVLASSEEVDGFYANVAKLTDRPFLATPDLTSRMENVWKDLEKWSTKEAKGNFGNFKVRVLGEHRFVGIPKSQCMVSRKDFNGVLQLFVVCGLRPQQLLTEGLFNRIISQGINAHFLSHGLKNAMRRDYYHEPLSRLLSGMLDSWDGQLPRSQLIVFGERETPVAPIDSDEVTVKLAPSDEDTMGWEIRWRFPASGNANSCFLAFDKFKVKSILEPSGACFSSLGNIEQESSKSTLQNSASADVAVRIEFSDEASYDLGSGVRSSRIFQRNLRILVWDSPDPRLGEELIERDMPISGPFYVLSTHNFRDRLEQYLLNEKLQFEQLPVGGLPSGWGLICLMSAGRLTREQRIWLTEGNALLESSARIRFVGGRPIIRGGTKLYAFYDLPTLELEAPDSTVPVAEGLIFNEIKKNQITQNNSPIRRFNLEISDKSKSDFVVKAMHGEEKLATLKFKVSIPEGAGVGLQRTFSLDNFGRSMNVEDGLRGALIGNSSDFSMQNTEEFLTLNSNSYLELLDIKYISENIAAKFLDSLAQLGSVAYGLARDQIRRLSELEGLEIQPALLLIKLRCAGYLEIETDRRGHMVRIHMVRPTLYSLPIKFYGQYLFGVCGSLRLQNWSDLTGQKTFTVFSENQSDELFPILRIACDSWEALKEFSLSHGFDIAATPCFAIANWAGSLESATSELSNWGWGDLSANLSQLQRLQPDSVQFNNVDSGLLTVNKYTGRQLFRLDDPSVQGLQVYVLGSIQEDGKVSFSFIHDSKWGIWISISAFAAMLKKYFGIDDGSPWPIHYEAQTGCIWLPARLRPPSVIERILTLCSGGFPVETFAVPGSNLESSIELVNQSSGQTIGCVNEVYSRLTTGTWLCYRWVPLVIAEKVANLLGGEIKSFEI